MMLSVVEAQKLNFTCSAHNCILSNYTNLEETSEYDHELDHETHQGLLAIKFESCEMYTVPKGIFHDVPQVLCLMATAPGFSVLNKESFEHANHLQFLYLQQNRIERLDEDIFKEADYLNEINLAENRIRFVSNSAFTGLNRLESLSLSNNDIAFFELETFWPLPNLMNLDISGNKIEFIDARMFTKSKNLNGINLANNNVISITNQFMNLLPSIKVLNMMNNPCTEDTELEDLPLIKILDSRDLNSEDESALKKCYKNFLVDFIPDTFNTENLEDLMNKAEAVEEDIEGLIIKGLNDELREKDKTIDKLHEENNQIAFLALISVGIAILVLCSKYARFVVNKVYESQVEKLKEAKAEAKVAMAPEKCEAGCYVIEITKH